MLALALALVALLAVPHDMPWAFDALCVLVLFPLILVAATNVEPAPRMVSATRLSADLSYPLYLLHLPLLLWLGFVFSYLRVATPAQHLMQLILVPALAYAANIVFDRPIQGALKARLAMRATAHQ